MAFSLSALAPNSIPKINSIDSETRVRVNVLKQAIPNPIHVKLYGKSCSSSSIRGSLPRLNAGFHEIEPDIDEDPTDRWETRTVGPEEFEYGKWDGYHSYVEGEDTGTMWEALSAEYAACEPPTGFQGIMSWLFLPAIAAGMYFNAPYGSSMTSMETSGILH
ncbi:photosynthetic NDH subunit of subcomplex B 5, chloroplastic isoform X2 [Tripterygium wilfordii]|uniref:photosynthetic NDH subunit of subcomplex B 5, chloroplastic isoform X2 n=1 Tax=Tripterygium wilfordii TaxID=458696 RepID=UPI0018F8440B|nr:photosynthetic NDH subunit of subcomplex B 5, chloroplastic isoform X2 [Tripterygium wilfordii]